MSVVPGAVDTDRQPPMTIPLRHFLVGLGFLLLGVGLGVGLVAGDPPGRAGLAHVHLLLVGWVCVTIMGAMTQFVPVWSGVALHARRLAAWQLPPVAVGLLGFVGCLLAGRPAWTPLFGLLMLAGFWTFVYNVGRTLLVVARRGGGERSGAGRLAGPLAALDVTERHFAVALGFFLLLTALGVLLAVDFAVPVFEPLGLARSDVVAAHATLAVFGAVLTTVLGALYQLGTMFTQTELHGVDVPLQRVETVAYPLGVVALAAGRLAGVAELASAGGLLVVAGIAAVAVVLARKLLEMRVAWTPMHRRYAVVAGAMLLWAALTVPAWLTAPLSPAARLGPPGAGHLLALGVVGFVVLGTLYHVVPFVVWVHRYSDRLGFETVPMIDDLYDDRVALLDLAAFAAGTGLLVGAELLAGRVDAGLLDAARPVAGALLAAGAVLFVGNVLLVVRRHSPHPLPRLLFGVGGGGGGDGGGGDGEDDGDVPAAGTTD
jgi:hypothetical protein